MQPDAIAFDAFGTLFDLEALREPLGDERFERFAARLLPWTWLATAAGVFSPLPEIASQAIGQEAAERLAALPAFGDVQPGLAALEDRLPLAVLSNGTQEGTRALVENAGLGDRFEHILTADQGEPHKPSPGVEGTAPRGFQAGGDRVPMVSPEEGDIAG